MDIKEYFEKPFISASGYSPEYIPVVFVERLNFVTDKYLGDRLYESGFEKYFIVQVEFID